MVVAVEIRQEHITLEAACEGSRTGYSLPGKVDAAGGLGNPAALPRRETGKESSFVGTVMLGEPRHADDRCGGGIGVVHAETNRTNTQTAPPRGAGFFLAVSSIFGTQ